MTVTLYDCATAPSPRRARILLAEKGVVHDTVPIDLRQGEHFSEPFRRINPQCTVPALVTEEGPVLTDNAAIAARHLAQVLALEEVLAGEVMTHLEFLRTKEGVFTCSGLQIIRYSTEERLNAIMQIYRDHGVFINNPHVFVVEDGKQAGKLAEGVLDMKHRFDPQGLLNPGKLRSWQAAAM